MRLPVLRSGALAALLALVGACGGSGDGTAALSSTTVTASPTGTTAPFAGFGQAAGVRCLPVPKSDGRSLAWLPLALPLPPNAIVLDDQPATGGYHRGTLAVPLAMRDLITFVLTEWPKQGWRLGRGDAENGEAEDTFVNGPDGGGFRARSVYCKSTWTEVFLVLKVPGATPSGGGTVPGQAPSQTGGGQPFASTTR
jgi:hypothetical protein